MDGCMTWRNSEKMQLVVLSWNGFRCFDDFKDSGQISWYCFAMLRGWTVHWNANNNMVSWY